MNIPLINTNDKESINTSLIAIKRATEELNNLIKIADEKMAQLDEKAKKYTDDKINALDVDLVGGSGKYISAISETDGKISATASDITSTVSSGNSQPVTSGGVADAIAGQSGTIAEITIGEVAWIKVCSIENWSRGDILELYFQSNWNTAGSSARKITIVKGTTSISGYNYLSWITVKEETSDPQILLSEIQICGANSNSTGKVFVYVKYNKTTSNVMRMAYKSVGFNPPTIYMTKETPSGYALNVNYVLHNKGVYVNGVSVSPIDSIENGNMQPVTSNAVYTELKGLKTFRIPVNTPVKMSLTNWGTYLLLGNIDGGGNFCFFMTIGNGNLYIYNLPWNHYAYQIAQISNNLITCGNINANYYFSISISNGVLTFNHYGYGNTHITILFANSAT